MFGRKKKDSSQPAAWGTVDPAKLVSSMPGLAQAFVTGSAEEGQHFDFAVEDAPRLDALIDLFLQGHPGDDLINSMVLSMGAYVGELIVRHGGGTWIYEARASAPAVELPTGLVCFPLNKVHKRITVGPDHSIAQFVAVAMSGQLPQGARPVPPPS